MVRGRSKKVVGYVRISSDSQIENTSIAEQRRRIEAYCVSQGFELVKVFVDEGKTGSNTDREGYQQMMELVRDRQKAVDGIVVFNATRIHRRLKNLLQLIEDELEPMGVAFISVSEKFDTTTAQGMLFLQMIGSFGEFERKSINERTRNGRIATAKSNKYSGGKPPYGYKVVNGEIHLEEEQAAVVKRIFIDHLEGDTLYKIAQRLNKEQVPTQTGKGNWTTNHIKHVINNETYTGFSTYDGKKEQNGIRQRDVFPRIISRQVWNKIHQQK